MKTIQIDVPAIQPPNELIKLIKLIIDGRTIKAYIAFSDYNDLIEDGFFVRDGLKVDSAGIINTSSVYTEKPI